MATAIVSSSETTREEEDNYTKMQIIMQKACYKVLRVFLLEKIGAISIDQFLANNRPYLCKGREGRQYSKRYFPVNSTNHPANTNLDEWDIHMLCFVLTNLCNLSRAEIKDIDFIREKRNYLCHLGVPSVPKVELSSFRAKVETIFQWMFTYISNKDLEDEIRAEFNAIDFPIAEQVQFAYKALHKNDLAFETLEKLLEGMEENKEILLYIVKMIDVIQAELPETIRNTLAGPESACAKLNVQNCRNKAEEEAVTETVIEHASKKGVSRKNRSLMQKCLDRLTKFGTVISAKKGCVEFSMKFNTFESCLKFIEDVISGKLVKLFEPLEEILREELGNDRLQLQFIMTDDQFYDLLSGLLLMLQMAWVDFTHNQQHARSETPHSNKQPKPTVHMLSSSNVRSRAKGLSSVGSNSKKLIVAAIDIGTSYSGYAYSSIDDFTSNPLKIITSTSQFMYKAPTKILLTPDQAFYAFGFDAENAYVSLAEEVKHKDWFFFEDIKMQLNKKLPDISKSMKIVDATGKTMRATTVFSMVIRYFKEKVIADLKKRLPDITDEEMEMVLTVPAVWSDSAKAFMREAAIEAGIRGSDLILGIEAEAGSIYCNTLALQGMDKKALDLCKPGCRFVVLDIGGGTVDVTAYEVISIGELGEIHSAGGGGWGGNMVNEAYIEMLYRIFGKEIVERFQNDNKGDFLEMQADFEKKKRALNETCTRVCLRLPISLIYIVEEHTSSTVSLLIGKAGFADDIGLKHDKLSISRKMFSDLFKPSTEKITSYLQNLLDSADVHNSVDKLILVGGFSQSPVVRNAIQDAFPHIPMYCPEDAELAVLKGAVIFGHTPRIITERVSKQSYGIAAMKDAVVGCPKELLYTASNGKLLMTDVFARFVKKGERVSVNHSVAKNFQIVDDKCRLTIAIFASLKEEVKFVNDEGCQELGELFVECEPLWQEYDDIEIRFYFGDTNIKIESRHKTTGYKREIYLNDIL